jgi:hypothetical protein
MKMKKFNMILALILATQTAFAGVITDDKLELGKPSSAASKQLIFKGPTKKTLSSTAAGSLGYDGNTLSLGDGTNTTNKLFEFNKGGTNPFWKYDFATGEMQSGNATAINHGANSLSLGDGTNSNKVLKFNKGASSPEIRYNSSTGKLQFTNDTTTYKDIGSGSGGGGGTNLLQEFNGYFEAGSPPQNWTASGGTFIAETTDPLFGLASGSWDSSASAQTLSSQLVTIEKGFIGKKCTADIEYKWASGVSADLSFQVVDQVPNILATVALEPTTGSNTRKAFLAFDCPTTATDQLRIRLLSNVANPALILIDNAFVGVNKSIINISQAALFGTAKTVGTTNCAWAITGSGYAVPAADTDCPTAIVTGNASAPATKIPAITFATMPPGKYVVRSSVNIFPSQNTHTCYARFHDGTSAGVGAPGYISRFTTDGDASMASSTFVEQTFEYATAQTAKTFSLQLRSTSGNTCTMSQTIADDLDFGITVDYFPSVSAEALNLETTGWFIDANIGGVDFSFNSITSTYVEMISGSLDMVVNTAKGSANAKIPCSTTNASTGLTCSSGSEGIGAVFTPPYAGTYEVCTDFYLSTATGNVTAFQLVETAPSSQTILQEGGQRTGQANAVDTNMHVCGTFKFDSVSEKTIRLMFESPDTNSRIIAIGRSSTLGQRDLKITVKPFTQNFAAPVFTELQNKVSSPVPGIDIKTVRIGSTSNTNCTSTPCAYIGQTGTWVSSATRSSTGNYQINFTGFSAAPTCTCTSFNQGADTTWCSSDQSAGSVNSMNFYTRNGAGGVQDSMLNIICVGPK